MWKEEAEERQSDEMWERMDQPLLALKMEGGHEPTNVGSF